MKSHILMFIVCLLVLLQSVTFPLSARANVDEETLDLISTTYTSPALNDFMKSVSFLGSKDVGVPLCLGLMFLGGENARRTGVLSTTAMIATSGAVTMTRYLVDRDRPDGKDQKPIRSSFPSGHASGAFAVATVVAHRHPRFKILSYSAASLVALSRVYLRSHYPSDVLVGSAAGYLLARLTLRYQKRVCKWLRW